MSAYQDENGAWIDEWGEPCEGPDEVSGVKDGPLTPRGLAEVGCDVGELFVDRLCELPHTGDSAETDE